MIPKVQSKTKGFTLIEIIVSMALFMSVALVAIGALLKIIDANKKSHTIKTAVTNLNFALESMTRELRVGRNYNCDSVFSQPLPSTIVPKACTVTSGPWYIFFSSSRTYPSVTPTCNLIYAYSFDGANLKKAEQKDCTTAISIDEFYPVISSDPNQDVVINFAKGTINVATGATSPYVQPYVRLRFTGSAGVAEKIKTTFDFQTSVSQRLRQ